MERRSIAKGFAFAAPLLIAIGAGIYAWGSILPAFTDSARAEAAFANWCGDGTHIDRHVGEIYFSLMTYRYPAMDGGSALVLTGLTSLGLVSVLRRRADPKRLRSPANRSTFILIGVGVVTALWGSLARGIVVDQRRMMFPPCADSIIIGLIDLTVAFVIVLPLCIAIGLAVSRMFGPLPVALGAWDGERVRRSWLVTGMFGILVLLLLVLIGSLLFSSSWPFVPFGVAALYPTESTRSALLSRAASD